jgi:hypothetical protein
VERAAPWTIFTVKFLVPIPDEELLLFDKTALYRFVGNYLEANDFFLCICK